MQTQEAGSVSEQVSSWKNNAQKPNRKLLLIRLNEMNTLN